MRYAALFFFFPLLMLTETMHAQLGPQIFIEAGGSGGLGSVNYEHFLRPAIRNHTGWGGDDGVSSFRYTLRVGLGTTPIDRNNGWVLVFPTMFNLVYGDNNKNHKLEIGAGLAPSVSTKGAFFVKSPLALGYRYAPHDRKYYLRLMYTPIVAWLVDWQWQHWAGVSIGFKMGGKNEN